MDRARYWWSEDGVAETVTARDVVLEAVQTCYHCGTSIMAGETAIELTASDGEVYLLHAACADRSVVFWPR